MTVTGSADPSRSAPSNADGTDTETAPQSPASRNPVRRADPEGARLLFRYLGGDEWREYRTILRVFADTFFAEFSAEDVAERTLIEADTVRDRLESLRRWGNLTVSSSVGNPTSIDDYYRRRHRYLITRKGQEVYDLVERVLATADEIGDVQATRLRDLRLALEAVSEHIGTVGDAAVGESSGLADAVRAVFDIHDRFTTELAQFFVQLNEWQNRYDLTAEEVHVFASVLVDYVSEQLTEIERMVGPVGRSLERIMAHLDDLMPALQSGLAARVEEAGLSDTVAVRRSKGADAEDWQHLAAWFMGAPGRPARLDQHTRQALAAVRTLTANVSRLARMGTGTSSRRSDFVRLAAFFDRAPTVEQAHLLAAAAFGLGSCRRLGTLSSDADDPEPTVTPWRDAPRATVPVSLRERGDTSTRGSASPMRDRRPELDELKLRRQLERVTRERTAAELLSCADETGSIDGARVSPECFAMLRDLIGRSSHNARPGARARRTTDAGVRCEVRRVPSARTVVESPDGRLAMNGLEITITADAITAESITAEPTEPTRS